jgi:hypothetical protein
MSDAPEKRAIISGIGISRIGRKTDFGQLDLTTESATAAIADAGLAPDDIDGIATMGETPVEEVAQHLGGRIGSVPMVGAAGLLAPVWVRSAVANGGARHVLVYRTVKMMGGSILRAERRTLPPHHRRDRDRDHRRRRRAEAWPASWATWHRCSPTARSPPRTGSPCTRSDTCTSTAPPGSSSARSR